MTAPTDARVPVTVVIAAHDEADDIEACVRSVSWAAEIIVVENDSTDDTIARARLPAPTCSAILSRRLARSETPPLREPTIPGSSCSTPMSAERLR